MADREHVLSHVRNRTGERDDDRSTWWSLNEADTREVPPRIAFDDLSEDERGFCRAQPGRRLEPDGHPLVSLGAVGVAQDVIVRDDVPLGRDEDAGADRRRR